MRKSDPEAPLESPVSFYAGSNGELEPAGPPAAKRLFARGQELAARSLLEAATSESLVDPTKRADLVRALELLGADRALVEEVSRVR